MTSSNGNIFRVTGHLRGEFPVNSPHKGQWRGALMFSLICVWINDLINNREAGDLRRYRAHYDVIVIKQPWRIWATTDTTDNYFSAFQVRISSGAKQADGIRFVYTGSLNHWGRVTHICVSKLTISGSDNGLSPGRCKAIFLTNAGILSFGPSWTNFGEQTAVKNKNSDPFFQENALENVVCEIAAILYRPQSVMRSIFIANCRLQTTWPTETDAAWLPRWLSQHHYCSLVSKFSLSPVFGHIGN